MGDVIPFKPNQPEDEECPNCKFAVLDEEDWANLGHFLSTLRQKHPDILEIGVNYRSEVLFNFDGECVNMQRLFMGLDTEEDDGR